MSLKSLTGPDVRAKMAVISYAMTVTRKSRLRGAVQRVGGRWKADTNGAAEWACELCAERARARLVRTGNAPLSEREVSGSGL